MLYFRGSANDLPSSRLPVGAIQPWFRHVVSAFGTVYYPNLGGVRGVPYTPGELLPVGNAQYIANLNGPINKGAVKGAPYTAAEIFEAAAIPMPSTVG